MGFYPNVIPTLTSPEVDPNGVGDADAKVNGPVARPRSQSLYADELRNLLRGFVGLATLLGLPSNSESLIAKLVSLVAGDVLARLSTLESSGGDVIGVASGTTYNWDSNATTLIVAYYGAPVDVTLPDATQTTNWPPGTLRRVAVVVPAPDGFNFIAPSDIAINHGALGDGMTPVPGTDGPMSVTVTKPMIHVYRLEAPYSHIFIVWH